MTFRPHALLAALLLSAFLSGCGTDTNTADDLGGNGFTANHFDSTDTPTIIEGYVLKKDDSGEKLVCDHCHKSDLSDVIINRQWADSAHAGHILTVGKVQDTPAKYSAWAHYDWDKTFKADGTVDADSYVDKDRADCQQCHTSTGNSNFMKAQAASTTYDPALNDFSHLSDWEGSLTTVQADQTITTSSPQNELLYCWGCHSNVETGALLAPTNTGITTANWTDGTAAKLPINVTMPNLGNANACVGCHTGRGNIETLMGKGFTPDPEILLTSSTVPKNSATATSTHYLNAAATIFKDETKVGYEFPGLSYVDPDKYGTPPISYLHNFSDCVVCHMPAKSHSFSAAEKDPNTGAITSIRAQESCNGCHTSLIPMNAAQLEESRKGYEEALQILEHELTLDGYVFVNAHPYFFVGTTSGANLYFKSPTGVTPVVYSDTATDRNLDDKVDVIDWTDFDGNNLIDTIDQAYRKPSIWATQGDLGAAHNFNYLHHEPGAYAHNRFYAKRLIYDSIDWLDDNTMNGSTTIDIAYPNARIWLDANPTGDAARP